MINPYLSFKLIVTMLLTTPAACINNSYASEIVDFSTDTHNYSSYREFAHSACLPCHYQGIPNSTDLSTQFATLPDQELKNYLATMLKIGNMPPDNIYREVLYLKFLAIENPR